MPTTTRADIQRIEQALQAGEADAALHLIGQLDGRWQLQPIVRRWRARALLAQERSEDALEESRLALQQDPSSIAAHVLHAQAAWHLGRLTPAQNSFERALQISRGEPVIRCEYALFMAGNRAPSVAEPVVQDALRASPESAEAWSALGLLRLRENRLPEATSALERAFQLDPRNRRGMAWMAMLLQRSGRSSEAAALHNLLAAEPAGSTPGSSASPEPPRERPVIRAVAHRESLPEHLFEAPAPPRRRRAPLIGAALVVLLLILAALWLL